MTPDTSAQARGAISLDNVVISYGNERAVHGVTLAIAPGEFVCLLGPSGCGKTTTLRSIAGLVAIDSGTIAIDGKIANTLPAHLRGIGMVFQDLALFPHMTVRQNIAFGLKLRGVDATATNSRIGEMLALLRLHGLEDRLPRQLSGGQQQRVALARSLVVNPSVLLMDEPFAALDRKLREDMRREIRALQRQLGITVVFVTHDQEEALTMADRVVVMNGGAIEQVGTPSEIYESPVNRFVLGFVGFANFLRVDDVTARDHGVACAVAGAECMLGKRAILGKTAGLPAEIAIRPERAWLEQPNNPASERVRAFNRLPGVIRGVAYEGAVLTFEVTLADGQPVLVREQNAGREGNVVRHVGDAIDVAWYPADGTLIQ